MRTWRCSTRSPDPFLSCSGTATCEPPHSPRPAAESFPRREILQEEKQRACRQRAAKITGVVIGIGDPFWQGTGNIPGSCRRFQDASPAAGAGRGSKPGFAVGHAGWSCSVHHPPRVSSPSSFPSPLLPRLLSSHLENAVGFGPGCPPPCPCWWCRGLFSTKPPQSSSFWRARCPGGVH